MFTKWDMLVLVAILITPNVATVASDDIPANVDSLFEKSKAGIVTTEKMRDDFMQMRQILEEDHCCLYEYTKKDAFDSLFGRQYDLINRPMAMNEFLNILTPITSKIGCGHTALWMPGNYWMFGENNLFPLKIRLIEDKVVAAGSYNDSNTIPGGSIIRKIGERPINDIINEMMANYSSDGFNTNFIKAQVERRFSMIFARRFGFFKDFTITYSLPGMEEIKEATLPPTSRASVRAVLYHHPDLGFQLIEEKSTAILTITTFSYYDRVPYFRSFVDSCFSVIHDKGIENLILDLRGNNGGDPFCAAPLFSYLEPEAFPYYAEPYRKYSELADPIPLAENHFTGNLLTLIDGRCFSTNGHFCALLEYHKIGKFVGTPSGSTFKCNAGKNTHFRLNNTRIMLYIGRGTYAAAVKGMDKTKPIMPDYPVKETYQDFLGGKDVIMETALTLIDSIKK